MHEDLKALLRAGWSFGLHFDEPAGMYRAAAKRGETVERGVSEVWPIEALSRVVLEIQRKDCEAKNAGA